MYQQLNLKVPGVQQLLALAKRMLLNYIRIRIEMFCSDSFLVAGITVLGIGFCTTFYPWITTVDALKH